MKTRKRMISLILVLALTLGAIPAYATQGEPVAIETNTMDETVFTGYSAPDEAVPNAEITLSTNAVRSASTNEVEISVEPTSKTNDSSFDLVGKFYPFPDGIYENDVIIGSFEAQTDTVSVQSVKISKSQVGGYLRADTPTLAVEIQNIDSGETYTTYGKVTEEKFSEMHALAMQNYYEFLKENDNNDHAYKDFFVVLALGEEFSTPIEGEVVDSNLLAENEINSTKSTLASKTSLGDFSYTQLKNMLRALRSNNQISLSAYGISPSFFTETGFDEAGNASEFTATKYTYDNGGGIYYTRLTMADLKLDSSVANTLMYSIFYSFGVMIEYVEGTSTAKLYLDDYGLIFKNVQLEMDLTGNTSNIFTSFRLDGTVNNSQHDVTGLVARVPEFSFVTTAWNAFVTEKTGKFGGGDILLGNTVNEQLHRWNMVIRGIAFDSEKVYIAYREDRMILSGRYNTGGTLRYNYDYRYTPATWVL